MLRKQKVSYLILIFAMLIPGVACMGTINANQTPQSIPSTAPILRTEMPIPSTTNTVINPTTPTTQIESTPSTGKLSIVEVNGFKDDADYWYFYGLVRNDTDQLISDLQIEIKLLDSASTELYTYTTYAMLPTLAPGETSPFSDFTTEAFPDGMSMKASVVGNIISEGIKKSPLEFKGVTLWADEYNDIYLAGEVTNANPAPVLINAIAGTMVDGEGKLVTASSAYPFVTYLEPNGSSPFVILFDAPLGQAASLTNYNLFSDAQITNPVSTLDIKISEQQSKYQDSNGDTHLVGSVTNNTTTPLNIYLVAGMYDKDGNCIDANVVYIPMPVNPGETFPYDFSLWGALDYVPAAYDEATDYKVFVDWLSTIEGTQTYILTTKDDTNTFDGLEYVFTGSVVNNSLQDLSTVLVSVSLYEKTSDTLIATNLNYVVGNLTKDASATYDVYLYPPSNIDPTNVTIRVIAIGQ